MKNNFLLLIFLLIGGSSFAQINTFPYEEDFETGANGWVVNGSTTSWELSAPTNTIINSAASGTSAWVTNPTGSYLSGENGWVESPYFDFTNLSCPYISMNIWWESEFEYDGAVLQFSTDSGQTWQNVGSFGDYEDWYQSDELRGLPGGQAEGWTGHDGIGSNGWITVNHSLNGLGGQSAVKLRVAFGSDNIVQYEGFAFDDVSIHELAGGDLNYLSLTGFPTLPTSGCDTVLNLTAKAVNESCSTFTTGTSVTFNYSDGVNTVSNSITLSADLNTGDTLTATFSVDWTTPGALYTPESSISVSGDIFAFNDTIKKASYTHLGTNMELVALDSVPVSGCDIGIVNISATVANIGCSVFTAGSTVIFDYNDGTNTIADTVILQNDLNIGDTLVHIFSTPANFSNLGSYDPVASVTTVGDLDTDNDTIRLNTVVISPSVSSFPYLEDFEGTSYWRVEDARGNSTWELSTPNNVVINGTTSGVNAWVTNASGDYNIFEDSKLVSPCFNFSSFTCDPWIEFSINYDMESGWDGLVLQFSIDGGLNWQNVGNYGDNNNWFNDNGINGLPARQQIGWTGNSGGWITAAHALTGLAGQADVRLRFAFGSDLSGTLEGVAIDDIRIHDGLFFLDQPTSEDYVLCAGETIELLGLGDGVGNSTYNWSTGETTQDISVQTAGNYVLTRTDSNSCVVTDTITVVNKVVVDLGADTTLCIGNAITLDAGAGYTTYDWSTGGNTQTETINTVGTFTVEVTDTTGCVATDTMNVRFSFAVDLGADTALCIGNAITLDAGAGYTTYDWSTGGNTATETVSSAGTYTVTVTDGTGCAVEDQIIISNVYPLFSLGADTAACESITLDAGQATAYNWSTGETTRTITVSNSTDVSVEVTNSGCPAQADTITLTIHPNPVVDLGADTTLCTGDSIILDAGVGYTTYDWSTGGSIQTETISATGNYTVEVVDANGCAGTDAIAVGVCSNINTTSLADTDFEIYPNPNTGQFNLSIHTDNTTDLNVEILDINGKVIYQKQLVVGTTAYTEQLNVSDLAAGVYLLRLTGAKISATKRLLIQQ